MNGSKLDQHNSTHDMRRHAISHRTAVSIICWPSFQTQVVSVYPRMKKERGKGRSRAKMKTLSLSNLPRGLFGSQYNVFPSGSLLLVFNFFSQGQKGLMHPAENYRSASAKPTVRYSNLWRRDANVFPYTLYYTLAQFCAPFLWRTEP